MKKTQRLMGLSFLWVLLFGHPIFSQEHPITIVIHGGAGTITRQNMTPEIEKRYTHVLDTALETGYAVLKNGGTSIDAVEKAIQIMEDSPLFNAGKGAVYTYDDKNELDAAIMEGKTLAAGAVAGVRTIKNPIAAARAVMEKSEHVLLAGKGAEQFAHEKGVQIVPSTYFATDARRQTVDKRKEQYHSEKQPKTRAPMKSKKINKRMKSKGAKKVGHSTGDESFKDQKFGTVGCVALDQYGNLAAGTSTGGMSNKRWNRIGDSPIIGAGTYANNATCAVSATGHGEYFIRAVVAHDISALMEYKGLSVKQAADEVVLQKIVKIGGQGGVIAIDNQGNIAMPFTTEGMYRGYKNAKKKVMAMYKE